MFKFILSGVFISTLSLAVQAETYQCFQLLQELDINIDRQQGTIKASLSSEDPSGNDSQPTLLAEFNGQLPIQTDGSPVLFRKTIYTLTDSYGNSAELAILVKPFIGRGGCGRAGCDDFKINATLKYKQEQTSFQCYEIF